MPGQLLPFLQSLNTWTVSADVVSTAMTHGLLIQCGRRAFKSDPCWVPLQSYVEKSAINPRMFDGFHRAMPRRHRIEVLLSTTKNRNHINQTTHHMEGHCTAICMHNTEEGSCQIRLVTFWLTSTDNHLDPSILSSNPSLAIFLK